MKSTSALRHFLCIASSAVLAISSAQAAILTWDAGGGGGAITNGGGAWISSLWNNGGVAATWTLGDDAIFGGPATAAGAVTLASPTTANSITFNPSFTGIYTLGTAGQALTIGTGGITMNAGSGAAIFVSPITLGGPQTWTNNSLNNASTSAGSLNLNSTLNLNGNALSIGGTGITSLAGAAGAVVSGAGGINATGGRLWLGAGQAPAHTYSGDTSITGGAVVMYSANLSANSNVNINGGVLESYWTGGLNRTIGTGATQIRITGGESGFGMNGSNASTFTLGALTWGDTNFNPTKLLLQTQYSQGTSAVTLASAINLNGADRTVVAHQGAAGTATSTISGNITNGTGTFGLIKEGLGLLTLTGASNTYNGGTTISAGTLAFDKIAAMPSTGVVAVNNATLGIDLGGGGDWTGSTTVAVGTLGGLLGGFGGAGTSTVTYTGNVGLRLNLTANTTYSGNIANVGTTLALTKVGANTLTLSGSNNSYTGATRIEVGQLTLDGSLTGGGAISTSGTATLFQSGTGVISGASSYNQSSTGASTLSGNNSHTGGTTLSAGTLALGHNSALGSGTVALNGTTIQSTDSTPRTLTNAVTIGNNFTVGGTGNLTFSNTGASALSAARTITVTNSGTTAEFAQAFSGGFAITKAGAGTLVLSGTNTNIASGTNPTYVNSGGGVLVFSKPAALTGIMQVGTGATGTYRLQSDADTTSSTSGIQSFGTGTLNLQVDRQNPGSGTGLDYNFTNGASGSNDISGGATVNISAGANITSGTPTVTINQMRSQGGTSSAAATINASGVNVNIGTLTATAAGADFWTLGGTSTGNAVTGAISHSVIKQGAGTWTLSGNSTYGTATSITNGVLKLGAAGSGANTPLGTTATGTTVSGTGTLDLNGFTLVTAEALSISGSGISNSGALANTGSAATFSGPVTLGAAARIVSTGNILLTSATAITSGFGLTLDGTATGSSISTAINTGANSVTKEGLGTWTLSNSSNTYSGATTITGGKLSISSTGTINNTSGVSIGAGEFSYNNSTTALTQGITFSGTGGTLSGTGSITPATAITSGNRQTAGTSVTSASPTAALGTQSFGTSIDFQTGSIFEWNLTANTEITEGTRGTNYDAVDTASLLNTGAEAIFRVVLNGTENFDEAFWNADRSWTDIFKNGGTALDIETIFGTNVEYYNSAGLVANGNTTGRFFTISGTTLNWAAVPEPTSALAGLLLTAGLLRRRRN